MLRTSLATTRPLLHTRDKLSLRVYSQCRDLEISWGVFRWEMASLFSSGSLQVYLLFPLTLPSLFCRKVMPRVFVQWLHRISSCPKVPHGLASTPVRRAAQLPVSLCAQGSFLEKWSRGWPVQAQVSVPEGAEMPQGSPQSCPFRNVDMPSHLQCGWPQHLLPQSFWFQSPECDSLNATCFHMHLFLSSCTSGLGCHKVTPWELCHSFSDPRLSSSAPQQHHLSQLFLQVTCSPYLLPL